MRVKVCRSEEIRNNSMKRFEVEGEQLLLVNVNGEIFATADTCTHADASLSDGVIEGHDVRCPFHGARFDVRDGKALSFPAVAPLDTYTVSEEDGEIFVEGEFW